MDSGHDNSQETTAGNNRGNKEEELGSLVFGFSGDSMNSWSKPNHISIAVP
jgi:hypothetical protein